MGKDKIFVVVNPAAGGGIGRKRWTEAGARLKEKCGDFASEATTAIGHARLIASEAAQAGYSLIVAYGGDGTIHEVVNGIFDSGGIPPPRADATSHELPTLGILSAGTGSDLIKTLGIPRDLAGQIDILAGKSTRSIDVGQVTYTNREGRDEKRVFVNITDVGMGAEAIRRLDRSRKHFGRRLAYITATLTAYATWPPREVQIVSDGESESSVCLCVVIANGRYFGSGMPIAPTAVIDDGFFDLVRIGPLKAFQALIGVPLLYAKQFRRLKAVRTWRARRVELSSPAKVNLDIDGELIGSLPATFELLPKALQVKI